MGMQPLGSHLEAHLRGGSWLRVASHHSLSCRDEGRSMCMEWGRRSFLKVVMFWTYKSTPVHSIFLPEEKWHINWWESQGEGGVRANEEDCIVPKQKLLGACLEMIHCNYLQSVNPWDWGHHLLDKTDNKLVSSQTWHFRPISNGPPLPSPDLENSPHWWVMGLPIPRTRSLICLVRSTQTYFFVKELLRKSSSSNNYIPSSCHSLQEMIQ